MLICRGDEVGIPVIADELAVGEEELAKLALVQELDHIVVGGVDAQLLGLSQQNLPLHQLLANLLLDNSAQSSGFRRIAGSAAAICWRARWLTCSWVIVSPEEKRRLYQWG